MSDNSEPPPATPTPEEESLLWTLRWAMTVRHEPRYRWAISSYVRQLRAERAKARA